MRRRWLLVVFGPSLLLVLGSVAALLVLPHPVPRAASPTQRLYLTHCASCHGADGRGSWRARLLLMRPGDLADPAALAPASDQALFELIKHGGATVGRPGMPAFGYHLSDEEIRALVEHLRGLAARARRPAAPLSGASGSR